MQQNVTESQLATRSSGVKGSGRTSRGRGGGFAVILDPAALDRQLRGELEEERALHRRELTMCGDWNKEGKRERR
eukprot:965387-Rhodomonas_salina.1